MGRFHSISTLSDPECTFVTARRQRRQGGVEEEEEEETIYIYIYMEKPYRQNE